MSFLFKLTIAILIVFAILFPILISSDNKLSALFWKIPKDFWVFLIIMYWAIITVVFIESSEQARIRCVFRSIRSRIGIEVRSAIRIHSINRELNFFYRFLTRFFAAFHYRGIFPQ